MPESLAVVRAPVHPVERPTANEQDPCRSLGTPVLVTEPNWLKPLSSPEANTPLSTVGP